MIGNGIMRKPDMPDHPLGGDPAFYEFNCTAFEIEVDTDTGEIRIHKHITAGDVGKALNPLQVESQDEGAAIMGLGHTLMEHLVLDDDGRIRNLGALDYRIPTSKDLPLEMHALMIENEDGSGQFTEVMLNPRMAITDAARIEEAMRLHDKAHHLCFLARSMNFPVVHKPLVLAATVATQK